MILDEKELDILNEPSGRVHRVILPTTTLGPSLPDEAHGGNALKGSYGLAWRPNDSLFDGGRHIPSQYLARASVIHLPDVFDDDSDDEDGDDPRIDSGIPSHPPPGLSGHPGKDSPSRDSHSPSFEPLIVCSRTQKLEDGFSPALPSTKVQPHPFTQRDVGETVWRKFVEDLRSSACLASTYRSSLSRSQPKERSKFLQSVRNVIQSVSSSISGRQAEPAGYYDPALFIERWNQHFFHERGLEVILAKGVLRVSGDKTLLPPDCVSSGDGAESSLLRSGMLLSHGNLAGGTQLAWSQSTPSLSSTWSEVNLAQDICCHCSYPATDTDYKPQKQRRAASWSHPFRSGRSAWLRTARGKGKQQEMNVDDYFRLIVTNHV
ncbi:hypothetical protein A7U60_g6388 [Sanghuangporus baumii]|uniref:Uncharacterized protein n=1 Tax=Sanghuangporus baumii TaxID=108892 RepID=A0A9Q5NAK1_SANBA|nr:hypothetical protein A7U60_g6388 [Sanghuangporus baumii]